MGADPRHGLLGGHHRPDDEADPQQHGHEHREAAHSRVGDGAGDPTAHQREEQNRRHHHKPVFDVQVLVFPVGIGADGAGQHVAGQGDPHRLVGRHTQKGDQHGADDRGGAHPGKSGAQPRPDPGDETDDHLGPHTHSPVPPGVLNPAPVAAPFPAAYPDAPASGPGRVFYLERLYSGGPLPVNGDFPSPGACARARGVL